MFEPKSGHLGGSNPSFRREGIAKTNFSQKLFSKELGVEFFRFGEALGAVFRGFAALERFEDYVMDFQRETGS